MKSNTVDNSNFNGNNATYGGAIYNYYTSASAGCTFTNNIATYGGAIYNNYNVNLTDFNSTFNNNTAQRVGGAVYNDGTLTICNSTLIYNTATSGGAVYNDNNGKSIIQFNRIIGNSSPDIYDGAGSVNATDNWWGTNFQGTNPRAFGRVTSNVNSNLWIILTITANPTSILPGKTSTIIADLQHDSHGICHDPAIAVVSYTGPANFATTLGSINDANFNNGMATTTLNRSNPGVANVSATVDNQTVNISIYIFGIISVDPADGAINVPMTAKDVTITFNSPIQAGSSYNSIYIWNNALQTGKMITKTIRGNTLTLSAVYDWMPNAKYTIYIPPNAVTDQYGNTLTTTFTTNLTSALPLNVTSVNPANGAINVPMTAKDVTITFNSPIQAGSAYNNIYIWNNALQTGKMITKTIQGNTLILTAVYNWMPRTKYTIYIPVDAVIDTSGNTLTDTFTTNLTSA